MSSSSSSTKVELKLLIDTEGQRVLFAEAGKDFVDYLFTLLSLPVATVIRLVSPSGMAGALGKLYESYECLGESYMQPNVDKSKLLSQPVPAGSTAASFLLNFESNPSPRVESNFSFGQSNQYLGTRNTSNCSGSEGFMKGVVTYMIMDDLEVKPMSTISSIAMLNKFNVKDVSALQEKVVSLGLNEGVKLLRASFTTKTVLTTVFLGN